MSNEPCRGLEEKIGYTFRNEQLLQTALTHTSFANEDRHRSEHNERLEFLGDSVLSVVVSEYLFCRNRHLPEGQTKIANIIGEVLGREKPGIGDVWLAERIRQMLSTGELRMLREDRERFYRSVVERT